MGRVQYTVKSYGFKKPEILSEAEFKSYKQVYRADPNFDMTPKKSFWQEFQIIIWLAIAIIVGLPLAIANEAFSFIPGLAIPGLIFAFIFNAQSMMNYQSFLNVKNKYYRELKKAIIISENYTEFREKASKL